MEMIVWSALNDNDFEARYDFMTFLFFKYVIFIKS